MSDLQRSFAKAHLSKLPPELHPMFGETDEVDEKRGEDGGRPVLNESLDDSSSSASSTGTIVPSPSKKLFEVAKESSKSRFSSLPWTDFFAQELFFDRRIDDTHSITHHAYLTPPTSSGPLFVTHHGAGSSGLSFSTFTTEIQKLLPNAGVLSLDGRGHGATTINVPSPPAPQESPPDLTLDTLSSDLAFVVQETARRLSWPQLPDIILVGHSLGGAVVTDTAYKRLLGPSLLGYGVLDVVEGSALDALHSMETYLSTRPTSFPSTAAGIEWHIRSRTIRNNTSARVSVPPLLLDNNPDNTTTTTTTPIALTNDVPPTSTTTTPPQHVWTWRTDLAATKPFWENWFVGLSQKFLSSRGGKLLLLAGTDRLDKELMIGQMQGKYQLALFPEAGHFVHEDQPAKTAQVVADFYRRNDRGGLVLPPKVSEMLKSGGGKGVLK